MTTIELLNERESKLWDDLEVYAKTTTAYSNILKELEMVEAARIAIEKLVLKRRAEYRALTNQKHVTPVEGLFGEKLHEEIDAQLSVLQKWL